MFRWRWWLGGDMLAVMTSDVGDRSDDWVMVSSLEKRGDQQWRNGRRARCGGDAVGGLIDSRESVQPIAYMSALISAKAGEGRPNG